MESRRTRAEAGAAADVARRGCARFRRRQGAGPAARAQGAAPQGIAGRNDRLRSRLQRPPYCIAGGSAALAGRPASATRSRLRLEGPIDPRCRTQARSSRQFSLAQFLAGVAEAQLALEGLLRESRAAIS